MYQGIVKELERLGFGPALKQQATQHIEMSGPHFTASEIRRVGQYPVKLLAHLTYDKKQPLFTVRSYDVIDLAIRQPHHRLAAATALDDEMAKVNWNAIEFTPMHIASFGRDAPLYRLTSRIEEKLRNMAVLDVEHETEARRLRLKYMYDTHYGRLTGLDSANGYAYTDSFNMLTLGRKSGLPYVTDAVYLLCEKNINNYLPREVIEGSIARHLSKTEKRVYPAPKAANRVEPSHIRIKK